MLVLTRRMNESVYIDDQIEVMVVSVRGNKVKLGFRAPANVSIQRREQAGAVLDDSPGEAAKAVGSGERSGKDLVDLYFGGARPHARPR